MFVALLIVLLVLMFPALLYWEFRQERKESLKAEKENEEWIKEQLAGALWRLDIRTTENKMVQSLPADPIIDSMGRYTWRCTSNEQANKWAKSVIKNGFIRQDFYIPACQILDVKVVKHE